MSETSLSTDVSSSSSVSSLVSAPAPSSPPLDREAVLQFLREGKARAAARIEASMSLDKAFQAAGFEVQYLANHDGFSFMCCAHDEVSLDCYLVFLPCSPLHNFALAGVTYPYLHISVPSTGMIQSIAAPKRYLIQHKSAQNTPRTPH
eukprot:GILI01021650.1.p1 GENE.GILI01021650.1~~GILI01021650.1.p1  ORF type:complete len:148 (+),score=5.03 GILI01021650.1:100-543(+)